MRRQRGVVVAMGVVTTGVVATRRAVTGVVPTGRAAMGPATGAAATGYQRVVVATRAAVEAPAVVTARARVAARTTVSAMRPPARRLPDNEPATFELPPARQRYGTGSSRIRSPARAASICISIFQP